jgi:hypothetical protein
MSNTMQSQYICCQQTIQLALNLIYLHSINPVQVDTIGYGTSQVHNICTIIQ